MVTLKSHLTTPAGQDGTANSKPNNYDCFDNDDFGEGDGAINFTHSNLDLGKK